MAIAYSAASPPDTDKYKETPAAAQDRVLTQAVLTRALAIERPSLLQMQLNSFPIGVVDSAHRTDSEWRTLWSSFFKGSLTKVALAGNRSRILYLNPIADVAVIVDCKPKDASANEPVMCGNLCAAPGEYLRGDSPRREPAWQASSDPFRAIRTGANTAVSGFTHFYGVDAKARSLAPVPDLCSRQAQAVAELRLFDLLRATKDFSAAAYQRALSAYIETKAAKLPKPGTDMTFEVLSHAQATLFSAAIPLGQSGWLVFLTPKHTGWDQALVLLTGKPGETLTVTSAGILSYAGT